MRPMRSILVFVSLVAISCKPGPSSDSPHIETPKTTAQAAQAAGSDTTKSAVLDPLEGGYRFALTTFQLELGTEMFVVDSDGSVRDLFVKHELVQTGAFCAKAKSAEDLSLCAEMRKAGEKQFGTRRDFVARYVFQPETLSVFNSLLRAAHFDTLQASYKNSEAEDGTTRSYSLKRLRTGETRTVSAYSISTPSEPESLQALHEFLRKQASLHESDRKAAKELVGKARVGIETTLLNDP
jgi:hypothetical protein